jgi:hypothetical protein
MAMIVTFPPGPRRQIDHEPAQFSTNVMIAVATNTGREEVAAGH